MIPRVIHQTWTDGNPPEVLACLARTWRARNPQWQYRLWTDADNRRLIEDRAPWFLARYDAYPEPIMRVDAFRYFLMLHLGGLYVDLDLECLRPIDELLGEARALLALEPDEHHGEQVVRASGLDRVVSNALLASAPGHPFWQHVIGQLGSAADQRGPLEAAGPFLLSRAFDGWRGEPPALIPPRAVYPLGKRAVWAGALAGADARTRLAAEGAFAVHHWMGTWVRTGPVPGPHPAAEVPVHLMRGGRIVRSVVLRRADWSAAPAAPPLVSALMVTKDRPQLAVAAIASFRRQTWPSRELVIVDDGAGHALADHLGALGDARIRHLQLPPGRLSLGNLRNRALQEARGELVCQWDDDDLFHPERMAIQVAALAALRAEACLFYRVTLWWAGGARVAVSRERLWESSLLARKASVPAYPELSRGEDTPVISALASQVPLALVDEPRGQVYVVHGRNTFPATHFELHWRGARVRHEGPEAWAWVRGQAGMLPVEAVLAALAPPDPAAAELPARRAGAGAATRPPILILVPVKDAAPHLPGFVASLRALDWPAEQIALGFLESDSRDGSHQLLSALRPELERQFRRVSVHKHDFGFRPELPRWHPAIQRQRRSILARSRNELLARALAPEDRWVLWLDADVVSWPPDLIQRLLAADKEVVVPHVVSAASGDTFDLNTWRRHPTARAEDLDRYLIDGILQPPRGFGRQYLGELQDHELIEVDAVGGCTLLVRADLHRAGVVFPEQPVDGLIETEGLAVLARRHGSACFGLPRLRVVHA